MLHHCADRENSRSTQPPDICASSCPFTQSLSLSLSFRRRRYLLEPKYDPEHRARLVSSSSQNSAEWGAAASLREPIEKEGWLYKKGKDSQKCAWASALMVGPAWLALNHLRGSLIRD